MAATTTKNGTATARIVHDGAPGAAADAAAAPVTRQAQGIPAPATQFAADLLIAAVTGGVTDLVVCPGSRSQSLALVAARLESAQRIRLHVRHDERAAAFFALGLARESGRAVPVITTSGTAAANLHPAMLEAFHAGIPLVAVTADRPAELIGIGANQATVQTGLFGARIESHDVPAPTGTADDRRTATALGVQIAAALAAMHVNLAFREPLSSPLPDLSEFDDVGAPDPAAPGDPSTEGHAADARETPRTHDATRIGSPAPRIHRIDPRDGVPTIVVAGDLAGSAAEQAAHDGGWPLIAEVSSGARFGRNLVVAFRDLLGGPSADTELRDLVGRVIVFGHPTLSREVPALMARDDVEVIVVGKTGGEPFGHPDQVAVRADALEIVRGGAGDERAEGSGRTDGAARAVDPRAWLRTWVTRSQEHLVAVSSDPAPPDLEAANARDHVARSRFARAELAVARQPVTREVLVDAVWRATWPHDRLVLGASRLVRVLDGRAPGKAIRVHANRGLAGIDGTIATALGVATASQRAEAGRSANGVTRLLLGDLALLHDAGALLVGQGGESAPRMQIIVGNDGGGTIFDGLEVAAVAPAAAFDRVQLTPHHADLGAIARAYGWHHERVTTRSALEAALTSHEHERVVIEVPLER